MKIFRFTFLIAIVCGCKEITYTPATLAQYTLGTGDSCTGTIISGSYITDTALNSTNTVSITVNVSTPGAYWVTTNTSNGISFSQAGNFKTAGIQNVILNATGTPIATDTTQFIITPKSGSGNSCSFLLPVTSLGPPHYYINCYVNSNYVNFNNNAFATNSASAGISGFAGLNISGTDTILNETDNIDFGIINNGKVAIGNYADTTTLPVYFIYTDSVGNKWKTDTTLHPSFKLSLANVFTSSVQGTFSGMLRKENATDSISMSSGSFFVPLK